MKKNLYFKFSFILVFLMIQLTVHSQCLSSWKYFMPVTVTNNTFASLTDYQVKLIVDTKTPITAGKMNASGNDIRFTDAGSCNNLNYWIESGINTNTTVIWVKMKTLPATANRIIAMYYGNGAAAAMSSGDSTFILFDDFLGTKLDANKWQVTTTSTKAAVTVANGLLNTTTDLEANIRSYDMLSTQIIAEANITSMTGGWESLAVMNANSNDGYALDKGDGNNGLSNMFFGQAFTPANPACQAYTTHNLNTNTTPGTITGIWSIAWPASNVQKASWPGGSFSNNYIAVNLGSKVQIAIGNMCGNTGNMSVDWIRVRAFAASDAATTPGTELKNHNSGIENLVMDSEDLNLYPNPAHNVLSINLNGNNANFNAIQILDVNGKILNSATIQWHDSQIVTDLSQFTNGIYFARLIGNNCTSVQKFIKE